ncbi:MAG: hypothetical protein IJ105_02605 [Bacilli bacterium]|nr:hypothetical protein [Bacilli bacterium]
MDKYMKNRFGYLDELDDESILRKKEEIVDEIEYLNTVLDDPNSSSEEKSEILNSDLRYERDRLEYVAHLIKERNILENQTLK